MTGREICAFGNNDRIGKKAGEKRLETQVALQYDAERMQETMPKVSKATMMLRETVKKRRMLFKEEWHSALCYHT